MTIASRTPSLPEACGHWLRGAGVLAIREETEQTGVTALSDVAHLQRLIEPVVEAAGFALVRVAIIGGRNMTLQVMAEDPETGQMTIDQCASLSRRLSAMLDEADPIDAEYALEVSSPGIDRPLTRLADFDRWAGHLARVELAEPLVVNGADRKRFQGSLIGSEGDDVRLDVEGAGPVALPFASIRTAKLLLTDALIAMTRPLDADDAEEETDGPPSVQ